MGGTGFASVWEVYLAVPNFPEARFGSSSRLALAKPVSPDEAKPTNNFDGFAKTLATVFVWSQKDGGKMRCCRMIGSTKNVK